MSVSDVALCGTDSGVTCVVSSVEDGAYGAYDSYARLSLIIAIVSIAYSEYDGSCDSDASSVVTYDSSVYCPGTCYMMA